MGVQIQKILFATDLTENSRHAFQYASSVAARFDARIVLLHAMAALPIGARSQLDLVAGQGTTDRIRENNRQVAREILIGKKKDDLMIRRALSEFYGGRNADAEAAFESFEIVIREGIIEDEILKAASEFGCDLIVLGSHKAMLGGTAIGGKTRTILHHAGVPVIVVPPPNA